MISANILSSLSRYKMLSKRVRRTIIKNPKMAYTYARYVIKGRWPEAEPYIMRDPESTFYYARNVLKSRWPEAESYIKKRPGYAYWYAFHVIQHRWREAEPYIKNDKYWWVKYKERFNIK